MAKKTRPCAMTQKSDTVYRTRMRTGRQNSKTVS